MMWWENCKTTCVMNRGVFMSVPSLEPVEPVLWKKITKDSEMDKKNKILLFKPVCCTVLAADERITPPTTEETS